MERKAAAIVIKEDVTKNMSTFSSVSNTRTAVSYHPITGSSTDFAMN